MVEQFVAKIRELLWREIQQRMTPEQTGVAAIRNLRQWGASKLELLRQAFCIGLRAPDRGRLNDDDQRVDHVLKFAVVLHGTLNVRRSGREQCAFVCAK